VHAHSHHHTTTTYRYSALHRLRETFEVETGAKPRRPVFQRTPRHHAGRTLEDTSDVCQAAGQPQRSTFADRLGFSSPRTGIVTVPLRLRPSHPVAGDLDVFLIVSCVSNTPKWAVRRTPRVHPALRRSPNAISASKRQRRIPSTSESCGRKGRRRRPRSIPLRYVGPSTNAHVNDTLIPTVATFRIRREAISSYHVLKGTRW